MIAAMIREKIAPIKLKVSTVIAAIIGGLNIQLIIFMRQTHLGVKDLLVKRDEIRFIIGEIKSALPS